MEEARKIICPTDIGCEAQAHVSSELHQTREVRVWISKHKAHEARVSEALPRRRDIQQHEVHVSSQRHETRVSTSECRTHEVWVSQVSPNKCDNQQREVCFSLHQRHETRISKPKCECRIFLIEHELRVSEPCTPETYVSELRHKVNIRSLTAKVRRELKSPHPLRLEAGLFNPLRWI